MPRPSFGPRRATTWPAEQRPSPALRVVRLGRPANDNARPFGRWLGLGAAIGVIAAAVAVVVALNWRLVG
ncbi:MAG: hypothetical protein ACOY4R_15705 [Pseudomonadota bacterium]